MELGGSAVPPVRTLRVEKGDVIMIAVDAKNGDHSCDLTQIGLKIGSVDKPEMVSDLASDIAESILSGNPHADRFGNAGTWSFVKGPTRIVGAAAAPTIKHSERATSATTASNGAVTTCTTKPDKPIIKFVLRTSSNARAPSKNDPIRSAGPEPRSPVGLPTEPL